MIRSKSRCDIGVVKRDVHIMIWESVEFFISSNIFLILLGELTVSDSIIRLFLLNSCLIKSATFCVPSQNSFNDFCQHSGQMLGILYCALHIWHNQTVCWLANLWYAMFTEHLVHCGIYQQFWQIIPFEYHFLLTRIHIFLFALMYFCIHLMVNSEKWLLSSRVILTRKIDFGDQDGVVCLNNS